MKLPKKKERILCQGRTCGVVPRVSVYKGHPSQQRFSSEPGKLMRLPSSMEELKNIAGRKFGVDMRETIVVNDEGAEIDSIQVIRDNDKLFLLGSEDFFEFNINKQSELTNPHS
ncbi:Potassium channel AKT2 [Acorus calamus]|uniref:Potassium channel AKT2 n=1 Tax=Acorus calamus TaxID=4465 RepID=A0AAV9CEE6_ACOCL|nr:Potassium channel AKT2 [Acorus calamus]